MPLTKWKTLSSHYLIRDSWMTLRADRCVTASGVVLDPYYVQESPDWVQVAAFDHEGRVLITRQYRHGLGRISAELPCGAVEPGEAPIAAMRRELLEETGCEVDELQALPVLASNAARDTNRVHSFVAKGAHRVQAQRLDPTEDIEFQFVPLEDVLECIQAGSFAQSLHVACLFLALRANVEMGK